MTITEEIQDAMLHGANAMFIFGLWAMFKRDQEGTMLAFEEAAKRVISKREVKPSPPLWPKREQQWK